MIKRQTHLPRVSVVALTIVPTLLPHPVVRPGAGDVANAIPGLWSAWHEGVVRPADLHQPRCQ